MIVYDDMIDPNKSVSSDDLEAAKSWYEDFKRCMQWYEDFKRCLQCYEDAPKDADGKRYIEPDCKMCKRLERNTRCQP